VIDLSSKINDVTIEYKIRQYKQKKIYITHANEDRTIPLMVVSGPNIQCFDHKHDFEIPTPMFYP
jgi:hypothetical protein